MDFRQAVETAKQYFEAMGVYGIASALDADSCWIIYGGSMEDMEFGGAGLKIMKESGKTEEFFLPDDENFELLEKAVKIELPED